MSPTLCKVDAIVLGGEKPRALDVGFIERELGLHDCVHEDEEST